MNFIFIFIFIYILILILFKWSLVLYSILRLFYPPLPPIVVENVNKNEVWHDFMCRTRACSRHQRRGFSELNQIIRMKWRSSHAYNILLVSSSFFLVYLFKILRLEFQMIFFCRMNYLSVISQKSIYMQSRSLKPSNFILLDLICVCIWHLRLIYYSK